MNLLFLTLIAEVVLLIATNPSIKAFKKKHKTKIERSYLRYEDQVGLMQELVSLTPQKARLIHIGQSYEGRNIYKIIIGYSKKSEKPVIFIDANIHGREWITSATAINIIYTMLTTSKDDILLRKLDVIILFNVNPDGYMFSMDYQRLWRKNRSPVTNSTCIGRDLNRNFPAHWGTTGVDKTNPCSDTYPGETPLDAPESICLMEQLNKHQNNAVAYVTLHSYGQYLYYPYGYDKDAVPDDVLELEDLALKMTEAIYGVRGSEYDVNKSSSLYPASGGSDDYGKDLGIKFVYTMELAPRLGYSKFEYPPQRIRSAAQDCYAGLRRLMLHVSTHKTSPSTKRTTTLPRPTVDDNTANNHKYNLGTDLLMILVIFLTCTCVLWRYTRKTHYNHEKIA